jgi:hypothetical protein
MDPDADVTITDCRGAGLLVRSVVRLHKLVVVNSVHCSRWIAGKMRR